MVKEHATKPVTIAYIGGGSKGWAWNLMSDLAHEPQLHGTVRLYDLDWPSAKSNELIGNRYRELPDCRGDWQYIAVSGLAEALQDADFVVISILPGDFQAMMVDVHAPEAYGIWQSVGDTTGPGGLMRSLRTIPMYVVIAEAIRDYAPDAWVINYTNPMAVCVRTLYRVFPGIKAFGCCHEVFGTQSLLADLWTAQTGETAAGRQDVRVNVLGINHFTWLDQASIGPHDLLPVYREAVERYGASGYRRDGAENWLNSFFDAANRVKFDLFRSYGCIAAAGDRHLAEFVPDPYLRSPAAVAEWKFGLTPVSWRISHKQELDRESAELAAGRKPVAIKTSGEEGVRQMKALLGLDTLVTNVNLPNRGQQPNLPLGAIVETNAVFSGNSVRPVIAGCLPDPVASLVRRHIDNQELIVGAGLAKDPDMAFLAFLNDPQMIIGREKARQLYQDMLRQNARWLSMYAGISGKDQI